MQNEHPVYTIHQTTRGGAIIALPPQLYPIRRMYSVYYSDTIDYYYYLPMIVISRMTRV